MGGLRGNSARKCLFYPLVTVSPFSAGLPHPSVRLLAAPSHRPRRAAPQPALLLPLRVVHTVRPRSPSSCYAPASSVALCPSPCSAAGCASLGWHPPCAGSPGAKAIDLLHSETKNGALNTHCRFYVAAEDGVCEAKKIESGHRVRAALGAWTASAVNHHASHLTSFMVPLHRRDSCWSEQGPGAQNQAATPREARPASALHAATVRCNLAAPSATGQIGLMKSREREEGGKSQNEKEKKTDGTVL